ncbi:DNA gyrase inhibitor YacG [Roseomonas xinghualingensis]|uniref:DNA gyrase inhibitor YacG n=1 Tax=Roseomonas xinghualingensis TaxID=2986475 RepID=UPI0021F14D00|nr:DNA gyrase inhibitor YacG [Roseomonas sp. SXEYE001]MCV4209452.1 DNA gyrase inhibitor YacG [Roseomonas sp. SXEYE001]
MPADTPKACPVCGKPAQPATRPFCSARCRNVDLGRWIGGTYAIPGQPAGEEDEDAER